MAKRARKLVMFDADHGTDEALKSIAIMQEREVPAIIAILIELMLDAVVKEPRVLIRLRSETGGKSTCFEHVALAGKYFRLATQLSSACGLTISVFLNRLLAVGIEYYPKDGKRKKEEIVSAIRADCIIRFSRLA
jgi:hypothetical protein